MKIQLFENNSKRSFGLISSVFLMMSLFTFVACSSETEKDVATDPPHNSALSELAPTSEESYQIALNVLDSNGDQTISDEEWGRRRQGISEEFLTEKFNSMDTNGDEALQETEWPHRTEIFSKLDQDADGQLSLAEFLEFSPPKNRREDPQKLTAWFDEVDTNDDGVISADEWTTGGKDADSFNTIDTNDDSQISSDELGQATKGSMETWFDEADVNEDGTISADEWTAGGKDTESFDAIDTNNDAQISKDELRAEKGPGSKRDPMTDEDKEAWFNIVDVNSDGAISADEWTKESAVFDAIDTNDDGQISLDEFISHQPPEKGRGDGKGGKGGNGGRGGKR